MTHPCFRVELSKFKGGDAMPDSGFALGDLGAAVGDIGFEGYEGGGDGVASLIETACR